MKSIQIASCLTSDLDSAFKTAATVEIEDAPLGQGGFGVAYRAVSFDGRQIPPQVVKLLVDTVPGGARHGFETIQELQRRVAAHSSAFRKAGTSLIDRFPALTALPQLSFEGSLEGRKVFGYSANDLTVDGFSDFSHMLEDDKQIRSFQGLSVSSKMRIAEQFVNAFDFLNTHLRFIHADIKAEAVFINAKRLTCAIIDFDSGALARDANDTPTTFGAKQDWLAPEIVQQLDAPANVSRTIRVNLMSDLWSVNVGIHYLFYGFHPFFFLTEISDRSMLAYFQRFSWPEVAENFQYFRSEYRLVYRRYAEHLMKVLPEHVFKRFKFTFNQGYRQPVSRTTYGQWKAVLGTANRPAINSFVADRTLVTDTRPVRLSWNVSGARTLELTGIGDVIARSSVDVHVRRDTVFELVLTPDNGPPLRKQLRVNIDKQPPRIHQFQADRTFVSTSAPVTLTWNVSGAHRLIIDNGVGDVTARSGIQILPRQDMLLTLTAVSPFGIATKATVPLTVSKRPPAIYSFQSDREMLSRGEPVRLTWSVSEDASEVEVVGIRKVPNSGTITIPQFRDTKYTLVARTLFGAETAKSIQVKVSKAPPTISSFVASRSPIREGAATELSWSTSGAAAVQISPGIGNVVTEGSVRVFPASDTVFTLCATSPYGVSSTASVRIRVIRATRLSTSTALSVDKTELRDATHLRSPRSSSNNG